MELLVNRYLSPDWLVEHGGEAGIWVIATVESAHMKRKLNALVDAFTTRILGPIANHRLANYLSGMYGDQLAGLSAGIEAYVRSSRQMLHILIPQLEIEE